MTEKSRFAPCRIKAPTPGSIAEAMTTAESTISTMSRRYHNSPTRPSNRRILTTLPVVIWTLISRFSIGTYYHVYPLILAIKICANSATGMRFCSPLSRSRTVTVSLSSAFSPNVSKSMVMQNGVPISSWRR